MQRCVCSRSQGRGSALRTTSAPNGSPPPSANGPSATASLPSRRRRREEDSALSVLGIG